MATACANQQTTVSNTFAEDQLELTGPTNACPDQLRLPREHSASYHGEDRTHLFDLLVEITIKSFCKV